MGHPEDYFVTPNDDTYPGALALDAGHSPSSSMALQFSSSRSRTSSTTRGHQFDEAVFQSIPKSTHGLARTVRRTLSGGLSNILRPFQPPVTKARAASSGHFFGSYMPFLGSLRRELHGRNPSPVERVSQNQEEGIQ